EDLTYLSLAAQAWRLARAPHARELLAEIYANYATHLASSHRFLEAERYAHSALDLRPDKSQLRGFYARAAIIAARSRVYRSARPAPARGLEMLRLWIPQTPWSDMRGWMLSEMAEYSALEGAIDRSIALSEQACDVVRGVTDTLELPLRQRGLAKYLLRVG